jgi:hypothetical protein
MNLQVSYKEETFLTNLATINSSLNVFDDGSVLLESVFWTLFIALMFFKPLRPPIEASSIERTQQSRFHLRTREEPSLET